MRFTREMIIEELNNRGFVAEEQTIVKNGIELSGITVKKSAEDRVAPTIYVEDINARAEKEDLTLSEVVDGIERSISKEFTFDIERLMSKEYFLEHVRVAVQREGKEDIVKRQSGFEGIEEYLLLTDTHEGGNISIKVREGMLSTWGVDKETAFQVARKNSKEETEILSIADCLRESMGACADDFLGEDEGMAPMYVISNKTKYKGASAMLDKDSIKALAEKIGVHEFVLLPSSIHECILVPKLEGTPLDFFESMVSEVNATTVDPQERLIDRAYLLTA